MPKIVWDNALDGLSVNSENLGSDGMYAEARDIDPQREYGFVKPGFTETVIRSNTGGTDLMGGLIVDAKLDPEASNIYAINATAIHKINATSDAFTSDANWPHELPADSTYNKYLRFYNVQSTTYLFYALARRLGASDVSVPTFHDTWSSAIPSGAATFQVGLHPMTEFGIKLWIGNGRYLASLDGSIAPDGELNATALTLAIGWEITSLFTTENYIGICASRESSSSTLKSECRVFFWDGTTDDVNYSIPIEDNKIINSFNNNGVIYLITEGRGFGAVLRRLTSIERGAKAEVIRNLSFDINGTNRLFYNSDAGAGQIVYPNTLDIFNNRILIGANSEGFRNSIFTYGTTNPLYPDALLQPYSSLTAPVAGGVGAVGFIGHLVRGNVYASFHDGQSAKGFYWSKFSTGNSVNANIKYLYKDFGQKVKVNYVKVYFKDVVNSTVSIALDTDFGTSNTIKDANQNTNISHARDGTISSKTFDQFNGKIECFAARPTLTYSGGGVAISKIVLDYTTLIGDR